VSNQVLGGVELLDIITVSGAAVQSVSFGAAGDGTEARALDGDADGEYIIVSKIKNVNSGNLTQFNLQPNGVSIGQQTQCSISLEPGRRVSRLEIALTLAQWAYVNTELLAARGLVYRHTFSECVEGDEDGTNYKQVLSTGNWDEDATNITSLVIHCNEGAFIGEGSEFHLYRRGLWL